MARTLVAYFSASGVTARLAGNLARVTGGDLYEILPQVPYTSADLDWRNERSRSSVEMREPSFRPPLGGVVADIAAYDVIFVGFPIWWYVAPTLINTFLERYDFSGKALVPFATSGGSPLGETEARLHPSAPGAIWKPGKLLKADTSDAALADWLKSLSL